MLICCMLSGLKATSAEAYGRAAKKRTTLKQAMRKTYPPTVLNLQPLAYRSSSLPLELEKKPTHMLNFGYFLQTQQLDFSMMLIII